MAAIGYKLVAQLKPRGHFSRYLADSSTTQRLNRRPGQARSGRSYHALDDTMDEDHLRASARWRSGLFLLVGQLKVVVMAANGEGGRMQWSRATWLLSPSAPAIRVATKEGFLVAEMVEVRAFESDDWPAVWRIVEPVFRSGRTYGVPTDTTGTEAYAFWVEKPVATFVATDPYRRIVGTYFLKPNHAGPGDHVANCGYIVDAEAQGRGIASTMCRHSLQEAAVRGFRAMQYNLVVATNEAAIAAWTREGFEIVGTLPGAFRHPNKGYVDAHVMFRRLAP